MIINPYNKAVLITKSDTINFDGSDATSSPTPIARPCDAIYVGGAGIVVVVFQEGSTCAFTAVAGEILPVRAIRVNSTTTTATVMNALYQA